jgi:PAS domain S-box-containing protein
MKFGYSHQRMIYDEKNTPVDYEFIEVNDAFESIIGIKKDKIVGKLASIALSQNLITHLDWIETFNNVCKTGKSFSFKIYFDELNKWLDVNVIGNSKDHFIFIFSELNKDDNSVTALLKDKLKETDSKYRKLFESANDAIFVVNKGIFIDCNDKTLEIFGCKREQIIGESPDYFSPELQPDGSLSIISAKEKLDMAKSGNPQLFEWKHKRYDSSEFYAEVSLTNFNLDNKEYILAIVRDISEKYEIYRKQKNSENFLKTFIKAIPGQVLMMKPKGEIIIANEAFAKRFNLNEEQIIGKNVFGLLEPSIAERRKKSIQEVLKTKKPWSFDDFMAEKYFRYSVHPIMDEEGKVSMLAMMITDITDRKKYESDLSQQITFIRTLLNTIPNAIFNKNSEGVYLGCNRAYEELMGVSEEEIIGKTVYEIYPKEYADLFYEKDMELYNDKNTQIYESGFFKANGEHVAVIIYKTLYPEGNGKYGLIGAIVDITSQKNSQDSLRHAKDMAENANNAIGKFVAIMSHEIRTPMNGIIGMTDLALDISISQEQRKYLENVKYAANSLLEIINNVLDFSKIEAGKIEIENIRFDLLNLVENAVQLFAPKCHENDIELLMHVDQDMPRYFYGDPRQISQILINLLSNAVKFTQQGEISLTVHYERIKFDSEKIKTIFFVNDTGIGIPENKINYIFDNFTQVDQSTTRVYGGTGLGLSIAKSLAENMDGDLCVSSTLGKGSSFAFNVDLIVLEDEKIKEIFSESLSIKKAIIVDDNKTNCDFLSELLSQWNISAVACANAIDGLSLINYEREKGVAFDILFIDYKMPYMDGIEMIKKIRFDMGMSEIPVVLMASQSFSNSANNVFNKLNIGFVLNKPFKINDLFEGIKNTVQNKANMETSEKRDENLPLKSERYNVMVVEDNPVNKLIVKEYLTRLGCDVIIASDGFEGVEKYQSNKIDLIFMDIHMPRMDGLSATKKIRELEIGKKQIPIVALTADAMPGDREKCLNAGMDHYISKPFTIDDLKDAITILLIEGKL